MSQTYNAKRVRNFTKLSLLIHLQVFPLKYFLFSSIIPNGNTQRGVFCFGAGNETCAFSGAPRQTAHRAVCFAVKWCGRISRSGKMLAPARSSPLKSRLDSITQNKNTPAKGVTLRENRRRRIACACFLAFLR